MPLAWHVEKGKSVKTLDGKHTAWAEIHSSIALLHADSRCVKVRFISESTTDVQEISWSGSVYFIEKILDLSEWHPGPTLEWSEFTPMIQSYKVPELTSIEYQNYDPKTTVTDTCNDDCQRKAIETASFTASSNLIMEPTVFARGVHQI